MPGWQHRHRLRFRRKTAPPDWTAEKRAGGTIDLVMHVADYGFEDRPVFVAPARFRSAGHKCGDT